MPGDPEDPVTYLRQLVEMLQPMTEHYAWLGVITPMDLQIPAGTQRRRFQISPHARTIRIETDATIQIWLNADDGGAITMGKDRKTLSLSDLPPAAAIHDIFVTTVEDTKMFILGVA
ncbi:MAG: hypothetical protein WC277_10000 [Bacilli bacterium]